MKKKLGMILLCSLMMFGLIGLAGCGKEEKAEEPQYPVLEDVAEPENMEEVSYGGFTAGYDTDKFVFNTALGQFAIYEKKAYESNSESIENINVRLSIDYEGPFTEKDRESLISELKNINNTGFNITSSEMKTFNGEPVIYYEAETKLTEEGIDLLIEEGSITESDIEALGGREKLVSMPPVTQIGMNAIIDGKVISVTGTYNENYEEILEAMKLLIKTGKIEE